MRHRLGRPPVGLLDKVTPLQHGRLVRVGVRVRVRVRVGVRVGVRVRVMVRVRVGVRVRVCLAR